MGLSVTNAEDGGPRFEVRYDGERTSEAPSTSEPASDGSAADDATRAEPTKD